MEKNVRSSTTIELSYLPGEMPLISKKVPDDRAHALATVRFEIYGNSLLTTGPRTHLHPKTGFRTYIERSAGGWPVRAVQPKFMARLEMLPPGVVGVLTEIWHQHWADRPLGLPPFSVVNGQDTTC